MPDNNIRNIITDVIKEKEALQSISDEQDFFEQGASSLTVVDLQLRIEELLGKTVDTAKLLLEPNINGWVAAYSNDE